MPRPPACGYDVVEVRGRCGLFGVVAQTWVHPWGSSDAVWNPETREVEFVKVEPRFLFWIAPPIYPQDEVGGVARLARRRADELTSVRRFSKT